MTDEPRLPLRPSSDPQVVSAQLVRALEELPSQREAYQGYLAQIVRSCVLAIQDGDLRSPQASLDLLSPALQLGERLVGSQEVAEATAWIRATSRFFEVAREALAPRITIETLLARDRSETEREVLRVLLGADRTPLRRGEIIERWDAGRESPTSVRIGQILASLHQMGIVVRVKQRAQGGSDVAFYRLSRLGRELCDQLHLSNAVPKELVPRDAFYARLEEASFADTREPLYLSTFVEPTASSGGLAFHDWLLANMSRVRRPLHWIFTPSGYFTEKFRPGIAAAPIPVHLYERSAVGPLEPTIQVFGDGGCVYPIAHRTALALNQDLALATWMQHASTAHTIN